MMVARRSDAVQAEIIAALRAVGIRVLDLHAAASAHPGLPDLLCSWWAVDGPRWAFLEIKSPGGRVSREQAEFVRWWPGRVEFIHSVDEALQVLGDRVEVQ